MTTRGRPRRLEPAAQQAVAGNCPHCPPAPIALVEIDEAGHALSGEYSLSRARCGRPHDGVRLIVVVQPAAEGRFGV
jgi:hypothetical protein